MTGYCDDCGTEPCLCHDQRAVAAMWRDRYDGCVEDVRSLEGSVERATARVEAAERERDEARALVSETRAVIAAMECPPYSTTRDITDEYVTGCHACGEDITSDEDGEHTWEECARGLLEQRDHFLGLAMEHDVERDAARIFAARWKALAKALHADQIHTIEDRAGGTRWRVAVSRSAQMAAKRAAAEADVAVVRAWGVARADEAEAKRDDAISPAEWRARVARRDAKQDAAEALADRLAKP